MQTYNQFNQGRSIMPLLINFTTPSLIQEIEEPKITYNDKEQISYEMRLIGTRSLRSHHTVIERCRIGSGTHGKVDKANEIDDNKSVR